MSWRDDLNYGLAAFGVQIPASIPIDDWASSLANAPAKNAAIVVMASAVLFLHFEKDRNPGVKDITDAMLYTSTCLSVGYAKIQPVTKAGKLLGSILMTYGPALAARSLDGARGPGVPPNPDETQAQILATLRNILARLEEQSGRPT